MFMLLSGSPPFTGESDEAIIESVKKKEFSFEASEFDFVSEEAKDLIKKLLVPEEFRITALQALSHPWFNIKSKQKPITKETFSLVSKKLKEFNISSKLKDAVKAFIISQVLTPKDTKSIRDVFFFIDEDNDGRLTQKDLLNYFNHHKDAKDAKQEAFNIMKKLDTDNKGFIEYSQFLRATLDSELVFSEKNVIMAFDLLDTEKKSFITAEQLMNTLSDDENVEIWKKIIRDINKNIENSLTLEKFIKTLV